MNWIKIGDMPQSGNIVRSVSEKITPEGAKKSRKVEIGDIILSNSMSFGKPYIMGIPGYIHDGWFVIREYEKTLYKDYLCQLLSSDYVQKQYHRMAAGGVVLNISSDLVNSVVVPVPDLDEQQKIADFLSLVDELIEKQRQLVEVLKRYKRGFVVTLFSNVSGSEIRLKDILEEVSKKTTQQDQYPVISSTKQGLFWQEEYFKKDIASSNNKGYKILVKGQLVFSPQNLWMGNINLNEDFDIGIVSPSYKIYNITTSFDPYFIITLFKTQKAMKEFFLASEQGASIVRRNLNMEIFDNIIFNIPNLKEQQEIACRVRQFQLLANYHTAVLKALIQLKQGLLQQMFI